MSAFTLFISLEPLHAFCISLAFHYIILQSILLIYSLFVLCDCHQASPLCAWGSCQACSEVLLSYHSHTHTHACTCTCAHTHTVVFITSEDIALLRLRSPKALFESNHNRYFPNTYLNLTAPWPWNVTRIMTISYCVILSIHYEQYRCDLQIKFWSLQRDFMHKMINSGE